MNHAVACYIQKLDKSSLVLGVLNPKHAAWAFPGGNVEPGESIERAAVRELREVTGLTARTLQPVYSAVGLDPGSMVHVFQVDIGPGALPRSCDPTNTVAWVTPYQLCDSKAFGEFYKRFFAVRGTPVNP